jgi:hypothetical protein
MTFYSVAEHVVPGLRGESVNHQFVYEKEPDSTLRYRETVTVEQDFMTRNWIEYRTWYDANGQRWGSKEILDRLDESRMSRAVLDFARQESAYESMAARATSKAKKDLRDLGKSRFQQWQEARQAYIDGTGTIDAVLEYVEEGENRYDGVYKHGLHRSRWPPWRWLEGRCHRRALGR